eukprot:TRINITY_DN620_c0_g1_i1.p1 TRINITY_DN620_c0_g1~~TRINITY_DN620_c0_g1_i1.p1  ORF type:complete len:440 (-),score=74.11 TRINITY_DN620_c0_g1_i1:225-1544(-)
MLDKQLLLFFLASLISTTFGQPVADVFPKELNLTFVGESSECEGVFAQIEVKDDFQAVDETVIIGAIAESFAIVGNDSESAIAAAESTAVKVLEVTAEAVATIDAKINSPAAGCWALAFGRAEAVAIATAVVDAIAEGITQAAGEQVAAEAFAQAEAREFSVNESIATIALLLVEGDGQGERTKSGRAVATAKAVAVNCAIAQAYAQVIEGNDALIVAIVNAGCPEEDRTGDAISRSGSVACECVGNERGFPRDCGEWGGADKICYVNMPDKCACAVASAQYPGQKWRFCGSTLETMQTYLYVQDRDNDINRTESGFGYCQTWDPDWDWEREVPSPPPPSPSPPPPSPSPPPTSPSPPPSPSPSPPPPSPDETQITIPTVTCPQVRCIGSAGDCCDIQSPTLGQQCQVLRGLRVYSYLGNCPNGRNVWGREDGTECRCV